MEWEYLIEELLIGDDTDPTEKKLNELGSGGWEAVAVWPTGTAGRFERVYILFKQPKSK